MLNVLAFVLVLTGWGNAFAQVVGTNFVHNVGGWQLIELKDTNDDVLGFWGIPSVVVEVGNIRRLWFEALPNGDWEVIAFEPVEIKTMIYSLVDSGMAPGSMAFLVSQETLAADTQLYLDIDGGVSGLVVKGFIAGDPLTEAAGSLADPNPMINLLAGIGYPIAPGMSELLVNGTAGVNVGMNQQTKQLIDCLRSTNAPCNEEDCVCVKTEGDLVVGPWSIIESEVAGNRLRCEYNRSEEHRYWQYGEKPEDCTDCTEGTAENPIIYVVEIGVVDFWYDQEHCPDHPIGY